MVFVFFVYPFAKNEYSKDKNAHVWAKVVNLIISFLLFHNYIGNIKQSIIMIINDPSIFTKEIYNQIGVLSPSISVVFWVLYLIMSISIVATSLTLPLRKEDSRKTLIKLLPFFWIIESIHEYKYWIIHNYENTDDFILPITFFVVAIPASFLYVLYTRKFIKCSFQHELLK